MVNYCAVCLHFHTLYFVVFALMAIVVFIVEILRLSYWVIQKKQSRRSANLDGLQTILPCPHIFFLSAPGYGYAVSSGIPCPVVRPDHILSGRLPLRSCIAAVKPILFTVFFCNSCFSQHDTRYVCEKLIDKILSVSRETQYFSVFFARLR